MWCDGFDLDLYALIPEARKVLEPAANIELFTHGHLTDGALNHPSAWNRHDGLVAFFGFTAPQKPEHFYTTDPIIICTFEEAVRDCWLHSYVILVNGFKIWDWNTVRGPFDTLMADTRGYGHPSDDDLAECKETVLGSLADAVQKLLIMI